MTAEEVRTAKQLFKVELEKLVAEAKVPIAIATSIKMKNAANATSKLIAIRPVLEEEEEGFT